MIRSRFRAIPIMPQYSSPTFRSSCNTRGWIPGAPKSPFCPPWRTRKAESHNAGSANRFFMAAARGRAEPFAPQYVPVRTHPGGEENMKIAQIAPLMESVPPRLYGGSERIASYLTDELVRLGHDVTLFASGDSVS